MNIETRFAIVSILAVIIAVAIVLALIAMVVYVIYYYVVAGLFAPTRHVMAQVVLKRQRERTDESGHFFRGPLSSVLLDDSDGEPSLSYDFFIVFEANNRRLDFRVPMSVYADVAEGDTGILVHKGNLFRGFVKDATDWSPPAHVPIRRV